MGKVAGDNIGCVLWAGWFGTDLERVAIAVEVAALGCCGGDPAGF